MTKKHEELVEEIPEELRGSVYRAIGNLIYYIQTDKPEKYKAELERLILLVGKAYADGEMKLPGEEGRLDADEWHIEKVDDVVTFPEGTILIAFRPEEEK